MSYSPQVQDEGVNAEVDGVEHLVKLKKLLVNLVDELLDQQSDKFEDIDMMLEGYSSYIKFKTKESTSMLHQGEHKVYALWFKVRDHPD